jgi:hypothetical protein
MDDFGREVIAQELEQLIQESRLVEREMAECVERQKLITKRLVTSLDGLRPEEIDQTPRYRNAAEAFKTRKYLFSEQQVRRICIAHAVGKGQPNEFAQKLTEDGPWHVREPDYTNHADRVDRGLARFRSK